MKTFATLASLLPGAAFAHGGHPPVAEAAHGGVHAMMGIAAFIAFAFIAGSVVRRKRAGTGRAH